MMKWGDGFGRKAVWVRYSRCDIHYRDGTLTTCEIPGLFGTVERRQFSALLPAQPATAAGRGSDKAFARLVEAGGLPAICHAPGQNVRDRTE